MKYHGSYHRVKVKPIDVIMRCVNCDQVADSEDIKFGCARCESYNVDPNGQYVPKSWCMTHPDGGWYQA